MQDLHVYINSYGSAQMSKKQKEKLLKDAKFGGRDSFGIIYDTYFDRVYKYLFYRTSHRETAEDLTEEVFTKAFEKISGFSGNFEKLSGWLMVIARNTLIDHYRKRNEDLPLEYLENAQSNEDSALLKLEYSEREQILFKALGKLSREHRQIIQMRFIEGLSLKDIAQMLKKSQVAVRVAQFRALKILKGILQSENL